MKKIIPFLLFALAIPARAEQLKTLFNGITGAPDYYTALSTNSIKAGANVTVSTTSSGVVISATGGSGPSGQINASPFGQIGYYSAPSSSNALTGSAFISFSTITNIVTISTVAISSANVSGQLTSGPLVVNGVSTLNENSIGDAWNVNLPVSLGSCNVSNLNGSLLTLGLPNISCGGSQGQVILNDSAGTNASYVAEGVTFTEVSATATISASNSALQLKGFPVKLGNGTAYPLTVYQSSIAVQNATITISGVNYSFPSSGTVGNYLQYVATNTVQWVSVPTSGGGGGSGTSVYPATATVSFPFGGSASTLTLTSLTDQQLLFSSASAVTGIPQMTWNSSYPGLNLTTFNGASVNDPNFHRAMNITTGSDGTQINPSFSTQESMSITNYALLGENQAGGLTSAKQTNTTIGLNSNSNASGQNLQQGNFVNCYGMGDCAQYTTFVTYAEGDVSGDEGQGFNDVSQVKQQGNLDLATIISTATSKCRTTLGMPVTASISQQNILVVSTANCNIGDHLTIGRIAATGNPNTEDIAVLGVVGSSITAVWKTTQLTGALVEPSVVLTLNSVYQFGQDRVLVNLSTITYSTGTIASIVGGGFNGLNTVWVSTMVGGDAITPGVVSISSDDYGGLPYSQSSQVLKSWYEIATVVSTNSIGIFTDSVAGDAGYRGKGPGNGKYTIRPGARVLRLSTDGSTNVTSPIYLQANSFPWKAGDSVEEIITPYPDVHGHLEQLAGYTPGGTYRDAYNITNVGARTFQNGITLNYNMSSDVTADTVAWGNGFYVEHSNVGYEANSTQSGKSFLALATPTGGGFGSNSAGYTFQGGLASGGMYANADSGKLILGVPTASSTTPGTSFFTDSTSLGNNLQTWDLQSNLILYGDWAGQGGPIFKARAGSSRDFQTAYGPLGTRPGAEGALYTKFVAGAPSNLWSWGDMFNRIYRGFNNGGGNDWAATMVEIDSPTLTVSAATNQGSDLACSDTAVWDGSAVQSRPWCFSTETNGVGNNAPTEWDLLSLAPDNSYNVSQPYTFFNVNNTGIVGFGKQDYHFSVHKMEHLDPSNLTADRTVTMPDASGTLPLLQSTETWSAGQTFVSSVTFSSTTIFNGAGNGQIVLTVSGSTYAVVASSVTPTIGHLAAWSGTGLLVDGGTGGGGGGTPATPFNSVQYNNAGSFGGSSNFQFNGASVTIVSSTAFTNNGTTLSNSYVGIFASGLGTTTDVFAVGSNATSPLFEVPYNNPVKMAESGARIGNLQIGGRSDGDAVGDPQSLSEVPNTGGGSQGMSCYDTKGNLDIGTASTGAGGVNGSINFTIGDSQFGNGTGTTEVIISSLGVTMSTQTTIISSMTVDGPLRIVSASSATILSISTSPTASALLSVSSTPATAPTDFLAYISSTSGTPVFAVQNNGNIYMSTSTNGLVTMSTLTFSVSSSGILGATDGSTANSGIVGQYISTSAIVAVPFPGTGNFGDLVSATIPAGDWDISAVLGSQANSATVTTMAIGISSTTGNSSAGLVEGDSYLKGLGPTTATDTALTIPSFRVSLSTAKTYYLKYSGGFSIATPNAVGRMSARRIR